ncbi:MAG: beta-propeller fold lactonase family protein [Terracidiphilus sp.]
MKIGKWAWILLGAAPLLAGCKGFWDAPSGTTSFALSNSGNISVTPGATSGNTSTITVTPASSFTGTVSLTCSVTSAPTGATSPATCSLSPASVSISSTAAQTSALTATTTSTTTAGAYQITVTGTSGSASQTTSLCAEVSSSSGSCTATQGSGGGVFYVLNQGTKQIVAYSINSGAVTQVGSPYTLSAAPYSIAIAPSGGFLYVGTATGIFLFDIGSNGALTLANNSNVISQDIPTTMQVDSTGAWLVDGSVTLSGVQLDAIPITSSGAVDGSRTAVPVDFPGSTVHQLAISPDNTHILVAEGSSGTEDAIFAAANSNPFGTYVNIAVKNSSGGSAVSVAVDPSSRLLYIGEVAASSGTSNTGGLRVLDYNTLVEVSGSPFATGGLAPYSIAPTLYGANKGSYVYVANRTVSGSSTGNIAGFAVTTSGSTPTLSPISSSASAGINPLGMTQDSTGNYLLVVNSGGSPDLQAFTFDSTTAGKLDAALTSATGTDPVQASAIAALP